MALFGNKGDGEGVEIDINKILAATGGALTGASDALAPEPEIDWAMVAVLGGLGLGLVLLLTARKK